MQDIRLDIDGDLKIQNGDLFVGQSTEQHLELLIATHPGEWKAHLQTGIGIEKAQKGVIDRFLDTQIRDQLKGDGFKLQRLNIKTEGISVEGTYENL